MTFQLPTLNYDYSALEPHIDARTMETHHAKHHQGYVNKANVVLEGTQWADKSTVEILTNLDQLPENIRTGARNNVGGVCNHSFFWNCLSPDGGGEPTGKLGDDITSTFGSFAEFKEKFTAAAMGQFGSGWAWLVEKDGALEIISTANQDSPLSLGYTRLLTIDIWEHAYYLNYQNRRPDYIGAFWNVVDWNFVAAQR
jgi:superoxide dismutase, Fe-Mn family